MSFIFGKNTPWSYEELQRQREIANALAMNTSAPSNVGEGLTAIGNALAYRGITKKAGKEEARMKGEFDSKWADAFSGRGNAIPPGGVGPAFTPSGPSLPPPDPNSPHALGNDAMAAIGKPAMTTAADPASIKAGLVARGLPDHIAEGFVKNFKDESGLNPGINEIAPLVPGSRGGFGLYQLTGPRRRAYEAYAAEKGVPVDDVDAQLDFMMMELQGPEAAAWEKISAAQNPGEAGAAIVNHFLRPSEEHRARREAQYLAAGGEPAPEQAGFDIGSLVALASDPMASPAQQAIVNTLIQQQLSGMTPPDPMDAIELEKAQLELEQLRNPQPGFRVLSPEEAAQMGLPEGAYQMGPKGEIKAIGGGGTNVTVNNAGLGVEPLGTDGQILVPDPSQPSGFRVEVAPGSKLAQENAAAATKSETREGMADTSSDTVVTSGKRALDAATNRVVDGALGAIAAYNPESLNAEVYRQTETLQAMAAAENINAMRQASPTGGALGNTSDADLLLLKQKSGVLDPKSPNYERDVKDYVRTLLRTIHGPEAGDVLFAQEFERAKPPAAPAADIPPAPEGIDPADWEFMSPEERALFQ